MKSKILKLKQFTKASSYNLAILSGCFKIKSFQLEDLVAPKALLCEWQIATAKASVAS